MQYILIYIIISSSDDILYFYSTLNIICIKKQQKKRNLKCKFWIINNSVIILKIEIKYVFTLNKKLIKKIWERK